MNNYLENVLKILQQNFYSHSINFNESEEDPEVILVDEFLKNYFSCTDWRGDTSIIAEQIVASIVNGIIDNEKETADTILYDVKSNNTFYSVKCSSGKTESSIYNNSPTNLRQLLLVPIYINDKKCKANQVIPIIKLLKAQKYEEAIKEYNIIYPGHISFENRIVKVISKSNKYFSIASVWANNLNFNIKITTPIRESILLENTLNSIISGDIKINKKNTIIHSIKTKKQVFGDESTYIQYKLLKDNKIIIKKACILSRVHDMSCDKMLDKLSLAIDKLDKLP
jgi:hypothetical protein